MFRTKKSTNMFTINGRFRSFNDHIRKLIRQGQNDKVKSYIKDLSPSNLVDSTKTSLLHLSAEYNNRDLTEYLIKQKCDIDAKNMGGETPLVLAVWNKSFKTAQVLIEANADIYAKNCKKISLLEKLFNDKSTPQYLINCCLKKVKSDSFSDENLAEKLFAINYPLNFVVRLKNSNVTRIIMSLYDEIDYEESYAAMDFALKSIDQENVSILLHFGVEIDISKTNATHFLFKICVCQNNQEVNLKLIRAFLDRVTDWNSLREESLTNLDSIFKMGTKEVLDLFLQYKVNDFVKVKFPGKDLLVNTFANDNLDAVEFLSNLEFDVNAHGLVDYTALIFAINLCNLNYVQSLLQAGANPNIGTSYGEVPLSRVGSFSSFLDSDAEKNTMTTEKQILILLLLAGADPQLVIGRYFDLANYEYLNSFNLEMMLAKIAIDEFMGTLITKGVRQNINRSEKFKNLYRVYCQQLENLKTMKVNGSVTLYTILVKNPLEIANKIHNHEALQIIAKRSGLDELNLFYATKLKDSINKILHFMDLKLKACIFICEATGWPDSLHIVLEKIISFLNFKDLLIFEQLE